MTLRKKTLGMTGAMVIVVILLLYIASNAIVLNSFTDLEVSEIQEDVARARNALADELAILGTNVGDYGHWDDTYAFVQDGNRRYVDANLIDETFINLQLNLMVFVNRAGQIVFAEAFDLDQSEETPLPSGLEAYLTASSPLLSPLTGQAGIRGLIQLPGGPLLVATSPILTSQYQGPGRGTLIFGRYLNDAEISALATTTSLSLSVWSLDADTPADIPAAVAALADQTTVFVSPLSERAIAGYTLLDDIYGNPVLVMRVEATRAIYQHGQASIRYLILSLLAVGLISGAGTLAVLDKAVLARLAQLTSSISRMGDSTDLSARVTITGRDELAHLADVLNRRLEVLEQTQNELQQLNAELEARVSLRTEQLRRTKDHAEAVLNTTRDAIGVADLEGHINQTNPAFNELFGYQADEAFHVNLNTLIDDRASHLRGALDSIATGKQSRRREVTARRKDGMTFDADMMLAPIRSEDREVRGIVFSLRDITERVHAEERHKAMVAGLRAVLLSANELIACPDVDTLFHHAVEIARSSLGLERCAIFLEDNGHLNGTYGTDRYGQTSDEHANRFPLDTVTWRKRLSRLQLEGPQWISVEEPLLEWAGEKAVYIGREGWIAITPIPDTEGFAGLMFNDNGLTGVPLDPVQQEVVSVFCSLLGNIYRRKRLEEDLRQSLAKEKNLNELKSRFSSMISHEFRTPLATIQSSTDLVKHYSMRMTEERKAEHLNTIQSQVQHLATMLDDILTMSKAESVGLDFKPKPADLYALCSGVVNEHQQNAAGSHQIAFSGELVTVMIDEKLLRQAIGNLLSNAVKYSPEGSSIYLDLTRKQEQVTICVRDRGIGIPKEDQQHLFQTFHRAQNVGNVTGTGLGLAITRHAVELHGGTIRVESEVGAGTTFIITLPLSPQPTYSS
jgi:PAS domain S-box-containing protein